MEEISIDAERETEHLEERLCSSHMLDHDLTGEQKKKKKKNGIIRVTGRFWHGSFGGVTVANTDNAIIASY